MKISPLDAFTNAAGLAAGCLMGWGWLLFFLGDLGRAIFLCLAAICTLLAGSLFK